MMTTPISRARSRRARLREMQIEDAALRGLTSRQIAAEVGVSQTSVIKALKRIEKRAIAAAVDLAVREKVRQLDQLQMVFREALAQWEKSKKETTTRTRKTIDGASGQQNVAEVKAVDNVGDPRFLGEARAALAARREILGLNAPAQVDQVIMTDRPAEGLSTEEIDRLIDEHIARRNRAGR